MYKNRMIAALLCCIIIVSVIDTRGLVTRLLSLQSDNSASTFNDQDVLENFKPEKNKSALLHALITEAELDGLRFEKIYLPEEQVNQDENMLTVGFVFHGQFYQLRQFFHVLTHSRFPYSIDQLNITLENGVMRIFFKMTMLCVQLDLPLKKGHFIQDIRQSDPFYHDMNSENYSLLFSFSVQQLQFAGYIKQQEKLRAVVRAPNGSSFEVSVGDKLGSEEAIVDAIDEKKVLLSTHKNHDKQLYSIRSL